MRSVMINDNNINNNDWYPVQVKLSYLEIYNENIRDLLNPTSGFLELREDTSRNRNIQVAGLSEVVVVSVDEVMGLLNQGNRQRTVEPTGVNKTSSRSHALLSVTVSKASRAATTVRQGRLFMIDLAGSERASHTKVISKQFYIGNLRTSGPPCRTITSSIFLHLLPSPVILYT